MTKNIEIINAAVAFIIKAAIIAARFSGKARKRSLKRLAAMDINDKDKEIIFLRDAVDQLKTQTAILQKLKKIVETAHKKGQRVRFWATPDKPSQARQTLWRELLASGVDLLNTDDLQGLQQFLLQHTPK